MIKVISVSMHEEILGFIMSILTEKLPFLLLLHYVCLYKQTQFFSTHLQLYIYCTISTQSIVCGKIVTFFLKENITKRGLCLHFVYLY